MATIKTLVSSKFTLIGVGLMVLGSAIFFAVDWYENKIDEAFEQGKQQIISIAKEEAIQSYTEQLERNKKDRVALESRLVLERKKVKDLERMLLVEHDLDRLLQAKPGLILPRVNKGTQDVLKRLEEVSNESNDTDIDPSN